MSSADFEGVLQSRTRNPTGHDSMTSLQKISLAITGSLEKLFYRWGLFVASNPKTVITVCLCMTAVIGLGMFNFQLENRPDQLWIPKKSDFAKNTNWLRKNFPSPIRSSWTIITADNVLSVPVLRVMMDLHEKVKELQVQAGKKWNDMCFKLPITKFNSNRKRRSATPPKEVKDDALHALDDDFFKDDLFEHKSNITSQNKIEFEMMQSVPDEFYCEMMKELDEACWEVSLAELWSFNRSQINNLTQEEIIRVLNHERISPVFGRMVNYTAELGGEIVRNELGEVISAGSIMIRWILAVNTTGTTVLDGTGEIVDKDSLEWEKKWINLMKNVSTTLPKGINVYLYNLQSWSEISEATLLQDGFTFAFGFVVMFLYVGIMLGRFNVIEQRPFLTFAGLCCIGFSCIISFGICALFGIIYGPVNRILPFLLIGIGVDDMFVIMQYWNNLYQSSTKHRLSIPERLGTALKHAGVSITVTSLTDIAAFTVGSSTRLPGLQSFCIYAAVGITAVFILQATFFVACFAIDQKRLEERRHAFFVWIKYSEVEVAQKKLHKDSVLQSIFEKVVSKYLFTPWAKTIVILFTSALLGLTIYFNTLLRQEFDPMWFLPNDSYMTKYVDVREKYYTGAGYPAFLVANHVNWSDSFQAFEEFESNLRKSEILYQYTSWYDEFKAYSNANFHSDIPNLQISSSKFHKYAGKFLYSPIGSKHRPYFRSDGNFSCGHSLPPLKTVVIPIRFKKFKNRDEHIPALKYIKTLIKNSQLSFNHNEEGRFFVWGTPLVAWETDEIINEEMYRNIGLSLVCVLITTFLLLANLRITFLCGLCVLITLVNVGGLMYCWNLSIDTVSCIDIILGIGLCVDYAAHIALAFMTVTGTRENRAKQALQNIGPAVLNGAFSTFLAIAFLANSKSYAFQCFFKIFFIVVTSGLFNGVVLLPILLSLIGPDPYPFASSSSEGEYHKKVPKSVEMKPLNEVVMDIKSELDAPDRPTFCGHDTD